MRLLSAGDKRNRILQTNDILLVKIKIQETKPMGQPKLNLLEAIMC